MIDPDTTGFLHPLPLPFDGPLPIVGMVHLRPLPGSPRWGGSMDEVLDRAVSDGEALAGGGLDGVMVENFGDTPFLPGRVPPETVAAMARAVASVRSSIPIPVGVNVLRNDVRSALGVAIATGAAFVRVNVHVGTMFTDQGRIDGVAGETLRTRAALRTEIAIFADVLVKHATPPAGTGLADAARETWHRGLADALVVSGAGTGLPTSRDDLAEAREAVPEARIWIGSGLSPDRLEDLLPLADGAIVGSAFQREARAGGCVEPERVARFMEQVERLRDRIRGR